MRRASYNVRRPSSLSFNVSSAERTHVRVFRVGLSRALFMSLLYVAGPLSNARHPPRPHCLSLARRRADKRMKKWTITTNVPFRRDVRTVQFMCAQFTRGGFFLSLTFPPFVRNVRVLNTCCVPRQSRNGVDSAIVKRVSVVAKQTRLLHFVECANTVAWGALRLRGVLSFSSSVVLNSCPTPENPSRSEINGAFSGWTNTFFGRSASKQSEAILMLKHMHTRGLLKKYRDLYFFFFSFFFRKPREPERWRLAVVFIRR